MKNIRLGLICLSILSIVFTSNFSVQAQGTEDEIKMETPEDYERYEPEILKAINYLENSPAEKDPDTRVAINGFVLLWLTGTPKVSIELDVSITELTKKNPQLLMAYMGGWTKFALENPAQAKDSKRGNLEGIKGIIRTYKVSKGKGMKKDKKIEKILNMNDSELKKWIKEVKENMK